MKIIPEAIKTAIINKTMTNREAAATLKISESWLSTLLKKAGVERTESLAIAMRKNQKELVAARREFRELLANQIRRKSKTLAQAAKEANCSERTMRRILDELNESRA